MNDYLIVFIVVWLLLVTGFIVLLFRLTMLLRMQSRSNSTGKQPQQTTTGVRTMGNTIQTQPKHIAEFKRYQPHYLQFEDLHKEYGEDRIYSGLVSNSYPLIIVADGVGSQVDPSTGRVITGIGGPAAQQAVEATREYLQRKLHKLESIEQVLQCLRGMYDDVVRSLKAKKIEGSTTLLVVLLWKSKDETLFWCFAYVGDGFINLLSPKRQIEGIVLPERLLSPQKVEGTAAVSQEEILVSPAVGCRLYEPDDLIYVASDGLTPVGSWLRKEHKMTLPYFILSHLSKPQEIKQVLSECPYYTDDAVLGIIWTETRNDRAHH